jgi:putative transcriptional regulator
MNIKELRKRTGLSQSKFADKFFLNVKTLQNWERGSRAVPESIYRLIERIMELEKQTGENNQK